MERNNGGFAELFYILKFLYQAEKFYSYTKTPPINTKFFIYVVK